jgi:hypothetical protein
MQLDDYTLIALLTITTARGDKDEHLSYAWDKDEQEKEK